MSSKHRTVLMIAVAAIPAILAGFVLPPVIAVTRAAEHPELTADEMLIDCAQCHQEATPELEKQWYDSLHGLAMVKCYECHGTFETFRVTPEKENCAVCHADMMDKCPQDKPCWECHIPHSFKAK